jgi:hypothetical protein
MLLDALSRHARAEGTVTWMDELAKEAYETGRYYGGGDARFSVPLEDRYREYRCTAAGVLVDSPCELP